MVASWESIGITTEPKLKNCELKSKAVDKPFTKKLPNGLIFYSKHLSLFLSWWNWNFAITCNPHIFCCTYHDLPGIFRMFFPKQAKQRYIPPCPCSHGIALQLHWQAAHQRPGLCQSHSATPEDFLYLNHVAWKAERIEHWQVGVAAVDGF